MLLLDKFLTSLTKKNIYNLNFSKNYKIPEIQKYYFLTVKSKKKLSKKNLIKIKPHFYYKHISFEKNYEKKILPEYQKCRLFKRNDISQINKLSSENTSNSRFSKDKNFSKLISKPLRYFWIKNFFKGNIRGNLIVCYERKKILGFLLLHKKKFIWHIDIICVSKKYQNKKVGTSLIGFANNKLMKKNKKKIIAGTQNYNVKAKNFYKKLGFKMKNTLHIYHSKNK